MEEGSGSTPSNLWACPPAAVQEKGFAVIPLQEKMPESVNM